MNNFVAILKYITYNLLAALVGIIDFFFPKKKDLVIVASHLGLIGNARFFAEHLLESEPTLHVTIFIFSTNETNQTTTYFYKKYPGQVSLYHDRSLKTMLLALQAGLIFISHDLVRDVGLPLAPLKSRRRVINLWHGIASKKHWLAQKQSFTNHKAKARPFNAVVASSAADAVAKAAVFQKPLEDIWVTGSPRNDLLVSDAALPADLAAEQEQLLAMIKGKTLILYAPTWRSYQSDFAPIDTAILAELTELLESHNAILGLRLHEKDEVKFAHLYELNPAILNLGQHNFPETQLLLKNTRILITDYSSIWLDFLLTGNPLIAYWYDYGHYQEKRGNLWDLDELFPGEKAYTGPQLLAAIERALTGERDEHIKAQYALTAALFHSFADGNNSQRIKTRAFL